MGWPSKAKDETLSRSCEQLDPRSSQGNCAAMSYSGPVVPWFWSYPSCYTSLDYCRMYIQPYYSQFPSMYPSCISQRLISNTLVKKDLNCSKEGDKDVKENSKYLQPRWCPSGLSHSEEKIATFAQPRINGATSGGRANKANNHEENLEAETNCFITNLK